MPVDGSAREDVRLRWSVVLGLVSGVLAIPLPHILSLAAARAIALLPGKSVACPSYLFVSDKATGISTNL